MRRGICGVLTAAVLVGTLCLGLPAWADGGQVIVDDQIEILDDTQALVREAEAFSAECGWDLMFVTTDDTDGREAREYAEDYFMDHYAQDDGIVYLIDMDNREIYVATSGDAIHFLTDSRIDDMLDAAYEKVSDGKYQETFAVMLRESVKDFQRGIPDNHYIYDEDTGKVVYYEKPKSVTGAEAAFSVVIGLIAGGLVFITVAATYRMKIGRYHYRWQENSKLSLRKKDDHFVRRFVTTRKIKHDPPSGGGGGGGSSVHTGSGGHSFGGGGRSF